MNNDPERAHREKGPRVTWRFVGKTKRARWSQIGQAMPPPLAEAVARAVIQQMERVQAPLFNAEGVA